MTKIIFSLRVFNYIRYNICIDQQRKIQCGYLLITTEHSELLIFETIRSTVVFKKQSGISNFDIFTYINSKFVYVKKHVRIQINELYRNMLFH